ncbi:Putative uncharacterized protein [Taphrina deformans PYCC 5710]|uniref:Uncharacterized protein n=1 Tax=Taphrina deformans (strain PYCC 5710 / ATCC 11124 / CBS 356.35 / IMI 108563 / JCM 9778 / NBRC 8474) TaxID=1097556 RepID=R4XDW1_TAPDE|nr:Putative uncharacterized protein [Taphrina deformans PYCC 5710]|eukprot:CCG81524.1 Putative uncharacterized protein [Taphrina deformans PYCC 5710]
MFNLYAATALLISAQQVMAQSATLSSAASGHISSPTPTTTRPLADNEAIVVEPTYVSSLSSIITTTYTTTSTTATEGGRPTGLPSSLYCQSGYVNATGPFCFPNNGTQQIKGKQYSITWNPDYAPKCADVYVAMTYYGNENGQQVTSARLPNSLGFWNYTVAGDWLNGHSSQYAQLQLLPYNCGNGTVDPSSGPIVELLNKAPVTAVPATSRSEILGLSIGLPLALIAFVGTAAFVMWWNKGHRQIPNFAARKKGYTGRKERNIRLQSMGTPGSETYRDNPDHV